MDVLEEDGFETAFGTDPFGAGKLGPETEEEAEPKNAGRFGREEGSVL